LRVLLESWESLGKKILNRKADTSQGDLDRWLEINERFHSLIISASRNRLLSKITNDVNVLSKCFAAHRGSPKLLSEKLVRSTLKTHRQLYEALIKRDSESARKIVCQQLKFGRKSVLNFFDQKQTP